MNETELYHVISSVGDEFRAVHATTGNILITVDERGCLSKGFEYSAQIVLTPEQFLKLQDGLTWVAAHERKIADMPSFKLTWNREDDTITQHPHFIPQSLEERTVVASTIIIDRVPFVVKTFFMGILHKSAEGDAYFGTFLYGPKGSNDVLHMTLEAMTGAEALKAHMEMIEHLNKRGYVLVDRYIREMKNLQE